MSFGGGSIHTEETRELSLRVNQSAYGGAKTRIWGKFRVPGNMLDYMDFTAVPHTTTQSAGGKGGEVESSNTSYTYTAGVVIGLCSGPIVGIGKIWQDKSVTTMDALGLTLKTGELRQSPWAHLTANHPDRAVTYSGIAYACSATLDLGSSASPPNLNFEVFGERIIDGQDDASPYDIIYDIVTDPLDGVGMSVDVIDNSADFGLWCAEMGISLSVGANTQNAARDLIAQVLKASMAEAVWSAGKIKIIPYGDEPVGTWTPVDTPVYDLTEADLLEAPRHKRTQPADATNRITLNFSSRANDYNTVTITRDDLSAVTKYGPRPETLDLPCITRDALASLVCEFWRDRELYIRNTWELVVDERFCLVEPMDLLTLTFGHQQLQRVAVRVVETSDDGQGKITLLVEEWPFGLLKATQIPTQPINGHIPGQNVAPGPVNEPVIFEAPNAMTAPNLEVWIGTSGGPAWGGAHVWVSDNGNSYQQVGTITNPARHGYLLGILAAGDDPDTTHTLFVDMSISHGQLMSGTQQDADNGNTLCWVDGEMISYANADLVDADRYDMTYLRRGQQGTTIATHASGSKFVRINEALFRYRVPRERIGSPIWIKLQSFNKYGRSPEPLDTVTPYLYTISGNKPLPLTALSAVGGIFSIDLAWSFDPTAVGVDYVEIHGSLTGNRADAVLLTVQKYPARSWVHMGMPAGQEWFYWGRVVDTSGNLSEWHPLSATDGVTASSSTDPSEILDMLFDQIGLAHIAAELAEPIEQIPLIAWAQDWDSLTAEINRLGAQTLVQGERVHSFALINTEQTLRTTEDEALAQQISTVAAGLDGAVAAIQTEETARVTADEANASLITNVQARLDTGDFAAVKTSAEASANKITGLEAKYTIKVNAAGHVAGMELLSGSGGSAVVWLADKFLFAKPDGTGTPQQIMALGTVNGVNALGLRGDLIVDGSIVASKIDTRGLTIKDAAGNVILGSGTGLPASYVTGLGSLALQSSVTTGQVSGLGSLATQNSVNYTTQVSGGPPANADRTASNIAAGIAGQGSFATLSQITAANVSTYIASAAIGTAQVANAAIGTAQIVNAAITNTKIGSAAVDTLKVAGNSVTVSAGSAWSWGGGIGTAASLALSFADAPQGVLLIASVKMGPTGQPNPAYVTIKRDGVTLQTFEIFNQSSAGYVSEVFVWADSPASGYHTYTLYMSGQSANMSGAFFALGTLR
jgi:hypothetical protein